jgi:hypothetical protein
VIVILWTNWQNFDWKSTKFSPFFCKIMNRIITILLNSWPRHRFFICDQIWALFDGVIICNTGPGLWAVGMTHLHRCTLLRADSSIARCFTYLHTKKSNFGYIWEGLGMEIFSIFHWHLVFLRPFVILHGQKVYFAVIYSRFGNFFTNKNQATLADSLTEVKVLPSYLFPCFPCLRAFLFVCVCSSN